MDIDKLNKEIISALDTDDLAQSYLADINNTKYAQWSKDTLGFIQIDQRIYVPPSGDLRLCVLRTYHPVSGHFSNNKTLALLHQEYTWLGVRTMVIDYCRSCTTCSRNKAKHHKPYGLLRQLPVPSHLWNSISMDLLNISWPPKGLLWWQMTSLHSCSVLGRVLVTKSWTEISLLSSLASVASSWLTVGVLRSNWGNYYLG